jgi:hypothetical protein
VGVLIAVIVVVVGVQHPSQPAPGQPAPSGRSAPSGQAAPPSSEPLPPLDATDDRYIQLLARHNITADDPAYLVDDAHQVCKQLRAGKDISSVTTDLIYQTGNAFTWQEAQTIIGAAVGTYCRDQFSKVVPVGP